MMRAIGCAVVPLVLAACAQAGTRAASPTNGPVRTGSSFAVVAQTVLDSAASKYRRVAPGYDPARGVPRSTRPDGSWSTVAASDWASGFFPGTLWYLHEYTLDPALRAEAERFTLPIAAVTRGDIDHDFGVQFLGSFGNAYRITRDERFHAPMLDAARLLAGRFDAQIGAIRSASRGAGSRSVLVENLADLELLLWSISRGGDSAWTTVASRHGERTITNQVRVDGSTIQVAEYDPQSGALLRRATRQGLADSTTWARGQAWGIYGFTVLHRYTRDRRFLTAAQRLADYALTRLPDDFVPCWDFQASGCSARGSRDASAAAIMASGLLELSTFVRGVEAERYREAAEDMLVSLASPAYLAPNATSSLLLHSVGDKPRNTEVDVGITYADYYFVEALLRYLQLSGQSGVQVLESRPR